MVKVRYRGGVYIEIDGKIVVADPRSRLKERADLVLVSHAHQDHYNLRALLDIPRTPKIMSKATLDIIDPSRRLSNVYVLEDGESIEINGLTVEAYNSGHVIGSLQFAIHGRETVVYTGDINLEQRIILSPAKVLKTDVLIIETTYGRPDYRFPPRPALYRELLSIMKEKLEEGRPIFFGARQLGVSQELTAIISLSGLATPVVQPSIGRFNRLYEKYGIILGSYVIAEGKNSLSAPHITKLSESRRQRQFPCTGWAVKWSRGIPISSHADFEQLLLYCIESGAEKVYTVFGFTKHFSEVLKEQGIDAEPAPTR